MKKRFHIVVSIAVFCLIGAFVSCSSGAKTKTLPGESPRLYEWLGDENYQSPNHVTIDKNSLSNQIDGLADEWWKDAVFYHIWVKSFNDYDGDGVGDFRGITEKLDYIKNDVGCDAIWLSPVFDCAGKGTAEGYNMHGYDTINYYDVNDYFGNVEQLENLLREAHKRGIKVIFDLVPNHTSSQHPWFLNSASRRDGKANWYLWNNVRLSWNPMGSNATWHFNVDRQAYYYGAFWSGMPDLNFRNYEVREEMKNIARYWLNKGFDGIRMDAVRYLVEDPGVVMDTDETHAFFSEVRTEVIDKYAELGAPKFMVGEAWIVGDQNRFFRYFGSEENPEFNMLFDFDFSNQMPMAVRYRNLGVFDFPNADHLAVFLSNHDNAAGRPGTMYKADEDIKLATAISLLLPATPFVYYGNEVGQPEEPNLGSQDIRHRYKLQWDRVEAQKSDPDSLLMLHKKLITLRSSHPALRRGSYLRVPVARPAAAYRLIHETEEIVCVYNLGTETEEIVLSVNASDLEPLFLSSPSEANLLMMNEKVTVTLPAKGFAVYLVKK
ncbi:DUF3459 domain-containing protein [Brucepastera parasyntrophica]|uniref:alpha-amylase family glycosyl hydrolase n=1 Tax=Brucepastera parasyntrophica TaxID=2880008 RepID=UPI00210E72BB|nr:alpha-amylase family glycosyl hydrolase [Brucepastera parasyntrophica]ULQ60953.1 DUF3459 domain-containing protein [Brucepastera parasyntrophica]